MENQRVRLSKKLLKEALINLLTEKSIDKITIYELCQRAQINRTTFYKYYGSQYELLDDIEADTFDFIDNELRGKTENITLQLTTILNYIRDNAKTMKVLTEATSDKSFPEKLLNLPVIRENILKQSPPGLYGNLPEYLNAFFFNGFYAIIRQWLALGTPEPPEELSKVLIALSTAQTKQ